jgi:hypothetical protein
MATAFVQEFAIVDGDTSTTNYDAVAAELGRTAPAGLILHTAGFDRDRGVFRIMDVWESREAGQRFMDEKLMPIIEPWRPSAAPRTSARPTPNPGTSCTICCPDGSPPVSLVATPGALRSAACRPTSRTTSSHPLSSASRRQHRR